MKTAIQVSAQDNVATATGALSKGDTVQISGVTAGTQMTATQDVPAGHKLALHDIATGEEIVKYAEVIGAATEDIAAGAHVHVHNCRGVKARRGTGPAD